jgi:Protein of unknown function (DUF3017)
VLTGRVADPATAPRPRRAVHDAPPDHPAPRPGQTTGRRPASPAPAAPPATQKPPAPPKIQIAGELPPPPPGQAVRPWLAQSCYTVMIVAALAGLAGVLLFHRQIRTDMIVVAAGVLVATLARLVLPDRMAGMLVARRRVVDVLLLAALGASLLTVALVLPSPA